MKINRTRLFGFAPLQVLLLMALALPGGAQQPPVAERVAMLKATIAASKVVLRQYEWVETTVVTVDGKENSRKQARCYYGADGKVTKVILNQSALPESPRGPLRRRAAEKKQEELKLYMDEAIALVRAYVPLDPDRVLLAKDTGNVSLQLLEPGKRVRVSFRNYIASGDTLALDVDLTNNRPVIANVDTHLDSTKDAVTLAVKFATLADGTVYPSEAVLDAKKKKLNVNVQNSGYRKM